MTENKVVGDAPVVVNVKIKPRSERWLQSEATRLGLNRSEVVRFMLAYVKSNEAAWKRWSDSNTLA